MQELLARLFNGSATPPDTLYLGLRTGFPQPTDKLANLSPDYNPGSSSSNPEITWTPQPPASTGILPSRYSRVAMPRNPAYFPDSQDGLDWKISSPAQQFLKFTQIVRGANGYAAPNYCWFLCDQASGYIGKLYASGPIDVDTRNTQLQYSVAVGDTVYYPLDKDYYLSTAGGVIGTGSTAETFNTGPMNDTNALLIGNGRSFLFAHPAGEPITLNRGAPIYYPGDAPIVVPTIKFGRDNP